MAEEKQHFFSFDPAPAILADMTDVASQLQEAIKTALSISPKEFPTDKEVRITLGFKALLVPDVNIHITRK